MNRLFISWQNTPINAPINAPKRWPVGLLTVSNILPNVAMKFKYALFNSIQCTNVIISIIKGSGPPFPNRPHTAERSVFT